MIAMLLSGAAVGAINGLVYVFGRLPHAFIITLAMLSICRGLALEIVSAGLEAIPGRTAYPMAAARIPGLREPGERGVDFLLAARITVFACDTGDQKARG